MYSTVTFGSIGAIVAGAFYAVGSVVFSQPFLIVNDLAVIDDQVYVDRTYPRQTETVADWSVVIVSDIDGAPNCHTIHGNGLHEGWSRYPSDTRQDSVMPIDIWVNDPGCYERLQDGPHDMFVTWSPRDGSEPVTAKHSWTVDKAGP